MESNPHGFLYTYLKNKNGILLPKLFGRTVTKNCSSDQEKLLLLSVIIVGKKQVLHEIIIVTEKMKHFQL